MIVPQCDMSRFDIEERMRAVKVLKFGGTSFLTLKDYDAKANYLHNRIKQKKEKLVVVVSGMAGTTGRLQEAAYSINENPAAKFKDSLLATAEIVGMNFLAIALSKLNYKVDILDGYKNGIFTDNNYTDANILLLDEKNISELIRKNDVIVVAGGQGLSRCGNISMLGRNSSDLTAIVLAQMLNVKECEIYSDIPGIYTSDPYIVPDARLIPALNFKQCENIGIHGAKILHYSAVKWAHEKNIKIQCKSFDETEISGTFIGGDCTQPIVVPSDKLILFGFENKRDADAFVAAIASVDLSKYFLFEHEQYVVVAFNQLPIETINTYLKCMKKGEILSEKSLITVHYSESNIEYHVVPKEELNEKSVEMHEELYEPISCSKINDRNKKKSALSHLIVRSRNDMS